MASRRKTNKKIGRGGRIILLALAALILALAVTLGIAAINANTIHVRRAELSIADLPAEFEGKTILFASDIDLCGINSPKKSGALFRSLQSLNPDILILGGDYTSPSLVEILNNSSGAQQSLPRQLQARSDFFHYISEFKTPLGKYGIACADDPDIDGLAEVMRASGIMPLFNDRAAIEIGGAHLWIAGISGTDTAAKISGNAFGSDECVIAVADSPSSIPMIVTSEASDSGRWADLLLTGHTHGGQLRLFKRNVIALNRQEQSYLSGWRVENGLPILTTTGVGCEGANLRLGSQAEVWFIRLTRKMPDDNSDAQ